MKIAAVHRLDDTCIEKASNHAETEEIEDLAVELLGKAQEGQSIDDELFCILYLAFRCGFKTAIGQQPGQQDHWYHLLATLRTYGDSTTFQRSVPNEPAVRFWIEPQVPARPQLVLLIEPWELETEDDLPGSQATADIRAGISVGSHWPRDPGSELVADDLSTSPR